MDIVVYTPSGPSTGVPGKDRGEEDIDGVEKETDGGGGVSALFAGGVRGGAWVVGLGLGTSLDDNFSLDGTIDADAAVTSWVKFSGSVGCTGTATSCLIDHCRRC